MHVLKPRTFVLTLLLGEKFYCNSFTIFEKSLQLSFTNLVSHLQASFMCTFPLYVFIISVIFCSPLMVIILQYSYWILQLLLQETGQSPFFLHFNFFWLSISNFWKKKTNPKTPSPKQNSSSKQNTSEII